MHPAVSVAHCAALKIEVYAPRTHRLGHSARHPGAHEADANEADARVHVAKRSR
jgi:hypothetical protein